MKGIQHSTREGRQGETRLGFKGCLGILRIEVIEKS